VFFFFFNQGTNIFSVIPLLYSNNPPDLTMRIYWL